MRIRFDCNMVAVTTALCHVGKHGFLCIRRFLKTVIFSLNITSNTLRADVMKKTFREKLRVKVGTKYGH